MEFNPIKVINPTQSWEVKKLDPRLDKIFYMKKSSEKFYTQKVEIWHSYGL